MKSDEPGGPRKRGNRPAGDGRAPGDHQGDVVALEFGSDPLAFWQKLRDWFYAKSRNLHDAEDAGMGVAISVWEKRALNPSYATDPARLDAFANRTTRYALSNQLRDGRIRTKKEPDVIRHIESNRSHWDNPELELEGNELLAVVNRGLMTIKRQLRVPWVLRKLEERTYAFIAKKLRISTRLARQRVCRCAVLIQDYVDRHWINLPSEGHS